MALASLQHWVYGAYTIVQDITAGTRASSPMKEKEHIVGEKETGEEREPRAI